MSFIEKYLIEPFQYATSDLTKIFIGGLLLSFLHVMMEYSLMNYSYLYPFLIFVIGGGYMIGVIKNTLEGIDTLPDWSDFIEIVKDGFLLAVAFLLLAILFLLIKLLIMLYFFGLLVVFGSHIEKIIHLILLFLMFSYFFLAMVNLAKEGFLGFFDFPNVVEKMSLEYFSILFLYLIIYSFFTLLLFPLLQFYSNSISQMVFSYTVFHTIFFLLDVMLSRAVARYYMEKEIYE